MTTRRPATAKNWQQRAPVMWRRPLAITTALVVYSLWLALTFFAAQLVLVLVLDIATMAGFDLKDLNQNLLTISLGALTYGLMLALTIGLPRLIRRKLTITTRGELGLERWPSWLDIAVAAAGFVTYFVLTGVFIALAVKFLPWFNLEQAQETGIVAPQRGVELMLVFALFVVVAPVVEEVLFRGYLYGKFRSSGVPFWLAAIVVSALFGLAHGQWNVAVDTFALSLVMCVAREVSGAIWPTILMHMMKNGIAFYFLFLNPQLIESLVK